MGELQLQLLDRFSDYARIEQVWNHLSGPSDCSYFLSWSWIENWLESLPKEVSVKLAVLENGSGPRSAFFLGRANIAKKAVFRSKAYLLNQTGIWDYDRLYIEHNSILRSTDDAGSLQQIVDHLPGDWEELYLSALAPADFPANDLNIAPPYQMMIVNVIPSPFVDLEKARKNSGGYLALLRSNVRAQVRRTYRGYESRGALVSEVAADLTSAFDIYDELIALHQAWWQRRDKPGAFASEYFRSFHRRLIEKRFASGEIQLIRLRCAGATIGCLYNFVHRGTVYFYQSGLAFEEDNRLKPGYLCHAEAVEHCMKAGLQRYEFLAGFEDYKERMSTDQHSLIWARVQKPRIKFKIERMVRDAVQKYQVRKRGKSNEPEKTA